MALLPYLDQAPLYNEFRQDEPWDSPHNKALIARMPDIYKTPSSPPTRRQDAVPWLCRQGGDVRRREGRRLRGDPRRHSNTLTIAVAEEPVPWTQPGELPFVEGQPLPPLDATEADG